MIMEFVEPTDQGAIVIFISDQGSMEPVQRIGDTWYVTRTELDYPWDRLLIRAVAALWLDPETLRLKRLPRKKGV